MPEPRYKRNDGMTAGACGDQLGISRQMITKIEKRAFKKLKQMCEKRRITEEDLR